MEGQICHAVLFCVSPVSSVVRSWRNERLSSDVSSVLHTVEMDLRHSLVRPRDRALKGGAAADDSQHSTSGGNQNPVSPRSPGVKHRRLRPVFRFGDAGDRLPRLR